MAMYTVEGVSECGRFRSKVETNFREVALAATKSMRDEGKRVTRIDWSTGVRLEFGKPLPEVPAWPDLEAV